MAAAAAVGEGAAARAAAAAAAQAKATAAVLDEARSGAEASSAQGKAAAAALEALPSAERAATSGRTPRQLRISPKPPTTPTKKKGSRGPIRITPLYQLEGLGTSARAVVTQAVVPGAIAVLRKFIGVKGGAGGVGKVDGFFADGQQSCLTSRVDGWLATGKGRGERGGGGFKGREEGTERGEGGGGGQGIVASIDGYAKKFWQKFWLLGVGN